MRSAGTMLGVLLWLSLTSAQCFSGYGIAKLQAFAPFVSVYTSQKQPCTCPGQVVARQLQERTRSLRGLLILRAAEGGTKDDREDDIFSDDFPSYNNVGDDDTGQSSLLSLPPVFDTTEVLMIPVSSIRTRTHPHAPSHSPFAIAHTFTHTYTYTHTHTHAHAHTHTIKHKHHQTRTKTAPADGVPNFTRKNPSQGAAPGFQVGFGGVGSRRSLPPFVEADMTEGLKERVYYVMLDAFDNYPPQEVFFCCCLATTRDRVI